MTGRSPAELKRNILTRVGPRAPGVARRGLEVADAIEKVTPDFRGRIKLLAPGQTESNGRAANSHFAYGVPETTVQPGGRLHISPAKPVRQLTLESPDAGTAAHEAGHARDFDAGLLGGPRTARTAKRVLEKEEGSATGHALRALGPLPDTVIDTGTYVQGHARRAFGWMPRAFGDAAFAQNPKLQAHLVRSNDELKARMARLGRATPQDQRNIRDLLHEMYHVHGEAAPVGMKELGSGRYDGLLSDMPPEQVQSLARARLLPRLQRSLQQRLEGVQGQLSLSRNVVANPALLEHMTEKQRALLDKVMRASGGRLDRLTGVPGAGQDAVRRIYEQMEQNRANPPQALRELLERG